MESKTYKWTYLQNRNRLADIPVKSNLWLPKGKVGRGGINQEFHISRCILLYTKQKKNKVLLYRTGNYNQCTGVGCHALLQGIFPIQGSNPGFLHCRQILYHLSHQGSPRIQEWAAYPFSRASSRPRNWIRVSCIEGGFLTSWATRE